MVRRISALAVLGAAAAALFFTARAAPSPPSPDAPVSTYRPFLQQAGSVGDEIQVTPQDGSWTQRVRGPLRLGYSWLECDRKGEHCSPLSDLSTKTIVPPQESKIVTLRGVVTATNRFGSTSVTTSNFDYDMAGLAFEASDRGFVHRHLQYDPDQLRAWYGLSSEENGAGQTIVIPDFGRVEGLRAAVDHFSAHYGLPRVCAPSQSRGCFHLAVAHAGQATKGLVRHGAWEAAADVEWVHAVAPAAKVIFVQFDHAATLMDKVGWLAQGDRMSVVSDSWCDPCGAGYGSFGRDVVLPHVASGCDLPHLVCVQASGDHGSPGDVPSNSPYVLAVGGTKFLPLADGATGIEIPWGPSGSGNTAIPLPRPSWQKTVGGCGHSRGAFCSERVVPDVSALAASVPVFTPTKEGWIYFYGTSLSTPLWAALVALADQQLRRDGQQPVGIDELHQVLYQGDVGKGLDDIPPAGWDRGTGLGSPRSGIVAALTGAIEQHRQGH
jgi:Subtilase family